MTRLSQFSSQWPAISALLDEALSMPAAEHASWLDGLTGSHAAHREALRTLLAHRQKVETNDFLAELPSLNVEAMGPPASGLDAGSRVGAYRLIAEIARGGMGTVWLAERADGAMKRRVALKLPRIVWGDAFSERLARERDILATLEHEHIARLYDAGVDVQGRPFLAMEYIEGEPIDAYCRAHALSVRECIELLLQVMAAVAHAHSRLIVHRDLKPGNILVTKDARVHLLDFGIAKLLEGDRTRQTALTELAGHALTPDYASPEQIRGEALGTASDVYSLAVVAYEVLTGGRPYRLKRASAAELEEAIATLEPPLASDSTMDPRVARQLRGDLDSILNKALKKAPGERYSTMEAFAHDLRRFLDGEPVEARPDGWAYRAAKFAQRYRLQVAAGGAVAIALVVGTSAALWQAHEAQQAAAQARTEAATAAAVQAFMQRVFLVNSGNQVDPRRSREMPARALLDQGASRIETDLRDAPEARLRLYETLADLYNEMALFEPARSLTNRRLALAQKLHGPQSVPAVQAMMALSGLLITNDRQHEALALLAEAEKALNASSDATPSERNQLKLLLDIYLADAHERQSPAEALPYAKRAVAEAPVDRFPRERVRALQIQAAALRRTNRNAEAQAALKEAGALVERDHTLGWNEVVMIYSTLADLQNRAGERQLAETTYNRALALLRDGAGAPEDLPITHDRLAVSQFANGRYAEAVASSRVAADWARQQPDDTPLGLYPATLLGNHGRMLLAWGQPEEALTAIDEGLAMVARRVQRSGEPAVEHEGSLQAFRALALIELGRLREAEPAVARSLALIGDNHTNQAGFAVEAQRRYWLANGQAAQALADFNQRPAQVDPDRSAPARRQAQRAMFEMAAGDAPGALLDAQAALAAIAADPTRPYLRYSEALALLTAGQALLAQGRAQAALSSLAGAETLRRQMHDPLRSLALAEVLEAEARALSAHHDATGAAQKAAEALAIRARHGKTAR